MAANPFLLRATKVIYTFSYDPSNCNSIVIFLKKKTLFNGKHPVFTLNTHHVNTNNQNKITIEFICFLEKVYE